MHVQQPTVRRTFRHIHQALSGRGLSQFRTVAHPLPNTGSDRDDLRLDLSQLLFTQGTEKGLQFFGVSFKILIRRRLEQHHPFRDGQPPETV